MNTAVTSKGGAELPLLSMLFPFSPSPKAEGMGEPELPRSLTRSLAVDRGGGGVRVRD